METSHVFLYLHNKDLRLTKLNITKPVNHTISYGFQKIPAKQEVLSCILHLYKVCKGFLAGGAGEAAIDQMNAHVHFEQVQPVVGLGTE